MLGKLKKCSGCDLNKKIWKSSGRDKYCLECWSKVSKKSAEPKQKKQYKISSRSSKMQKLDLVYKVMREQYLKAHPVCEAKLPGCLGQSQEIHHKCGRIGESYLDSTQWLAVDRNCHLWIEKNVEKAKELGFSINRLDNEKEK